MNSHSNRYVCNLSDVDLEKAVEELNEPADNDERLQRIDKLRGAFINQDANLQLFREDDCFILRFLRARKFNHKKALELLTNFHIQQQKWPEVFDNIKNPSRIRHIFDAGCIIALEEKALDNSSVCIGRPGKSEYMLLTEFLAAMALSLDHLLQDELVQIYGVTVIYDLTYFSRHLARQMGPALAKRFMAFLQDAMPMRIQSVNFVKEPKIFSFVFAVIRLFIKNKYHVHGNTFDQLHTIVDPTILPPVYAGTGQDLDGVLCRKWKNTIIGEDTSA